MAIKVSIDQWVVVSKSRTDLFTDNLNGCVAIAVESDQQIALTHVLAGVNAGQEWPQYTHNLDLMLIVMRKRSALTKAIVFFVEDQPTSLVTSIETYLATKNIPDIKRVANAPGCRVSTATVAFGPRRGVAVMSTTTRQEDGTRFDYSTSNFVRVSTAGTGLVDNWGKLQPNAMDCE